MLLKFPREETLRKKVSTPSNLTIYVFHKLISSVVCHLDYHLLISSGTVQYSISASILQDVN